MSISALARSEREELCELMEEVGADAPTLNEGWAVLDLAAHLVAREHDVWSGPGIMLKRSLGFLTELAMERRRREGLESLIEVIRRGEPIWFRPLPAGGQLYEYFLHHEDVRRASGLGPRTDRSDLDEGLARLIRIGGRLLLRRVDVGVDLVWQGGVIHRHGSEPRAIVDGAPGELMLYMTGRGRVAEVTLGGDETAAERLAETDLRI